MDGRLSIRSRLCICLLALFVLAGRDRRLRRARMEFSPGTIADNDGVIPGAMVIATDPDDRSCPLGDLQRSGDVPDSLAAARQVRAACGDGGLQADHPERRPAVERRDARPRQAGAAGRHARQRP